MKKSVKKTETYDRLSVKATYASGGGFTFSITRSGSRLTWKGNSDSESQTFMQWAKQREKDETNGQRIERIYQAAQNANSIAELIASLK